MRSEVGMMRSAGRMMAVEPAGPPHPAGTTRLTTEMFYREKCIAPLSGRPAPVPTAGIPVSGGMSPLSRAMGGPPR